MFRGARAAVSTASAVGVRLYAGDRLRLGGHGVEMINERDALAAYTDSAAAGRRAG